MFKNSKIKELIVSVICMIFSCNVSGHQRLASGLSLEEALSRYIDQLNYLEEAIPKQHLQVPFTWKNAFSNGTIITFYTLFTQSTISFEKICLFFNLAAYLSQHAAGKGNPNEEEGLRNAAKLFQRSAGIFQYIRHASSVSTVEGVTTDLHIGTLQALENLCLAQAQECFYLKALQVPTITKCILANVENTNNILTRLI